MVNWRAAQKKGTFGIMQHGNRLTERYLSQPIKMWNLHQSCVNDYFQWRKTLSNMKSYQCDCNTLVHKAQIGNQFLNCVSGPIHVGLAMQGVGGWLLQHRRFTWHYLSKVGLIAVKLFHAWLIYLFLVLLVFLPSGDSVESRDFLFDGI